MSNTKFSIFFTADIHGRDMKSAQLFSVYKRERDEAEKEGRNCLFFDSGDSSDRCIDYCSLTKCRAYGHILNAFAYDAQTVGNDIGLVYGPNALIDALKEIKIPVLGANFRDGKKPLLEGLQENILLTVNDVKIGVFGLTNPWSGAYESYGYKFPDAKKCAAEQVQLLKKQGAQIIVFLSHMGIIDDMQIVFNLPGVDIVLGGHSHSLTPGGVFNHHGTVFHHCGSYAQHMGRIDFEFNNEKYEIENLQASLCSNSEDESHAEEIIHAIESARKEAAVLGDEKIGSTEIALSLDYQRECELGKFAADALRHYSKTDIAIVAGGNFSRSIEPGEITMADLSRACFSTANPCISRITGKSLKECLENGLDDELRNFYHHGLRGAPIGIPQISGLSVTADLSCLKGERIQTVSISGNPIDNNKSYLIAHTDLENHKTLGYFPPSGHELKKIESDTYLTDVLVGYLKLYPDVQLSSDIRWQFS